MIAIDNISYSIGAFRLNVSLDIADEDYFVLAGKTGCGKTTLIECLCGLRPVSSGRIFVDGKDVTDLDPRHRRIGYVPQDGALFDHMSVRDNVLFALKVRKTPRAEMEETLHELADRVAIGHLLDRSIPGLSGGERQRVALARALAAKPRALLLDEPVSALDESLRDKVCRELVAIRRGLHVPVIHVCHSSEEARLVATRMAVMREGRIEQVAPPEEMFNRPRNAFVASFLRMDNIFSGTGVAVNGLRFIKSGEICLKADAPAGALDFVVHPWQIGVTASGEAQGENVIRGKIADLTYIGPLARVQIDGTLPLVVQLSRNEAIRLRLAAGQPIAMSVEPDAICVLEGQTQGSEVRSV